MARQTVCIRLPEDDRDRLRATIHDRSRPFKHVQRARIVLASDRQPQVLKVAESAGCSRPAVWRWQQRYAEEGIDGLLRDKTRQRIHRGVFHCLVDLQAALNRWIAALNADPKPFVWTKPADVILAKLQRCPAPSV